LLVTKAVPDKFKSSIAHKAVRVFLMGTMATATNYKQNV